MKDCLIGRGKIRGGISGKVGKQSGAWEGFKKADYQSPWYYQYPCPQKAVCMGWEKKSNPKNQRGAKKQGTKLGERALPGGDLQSGSFGTPWRRFFRSLRHPPGGSAVLTPGTHSPGQSFFVKLVRKGLWSGQKIKSSKSGAARARKIELINLMAKILLEKHERGAKKPKD